MSVPATDQDRLDAAQAALHKLLTGTSVVEVDTGQYRAKFTPANIDALRSYIAELQQKLAGAAPRGAIGFIF